MGNNKFSSLKQAYQQDGFLSGIRILSEAEVGKHRQQMENAESQIGPLHYKPKMHTLLRSPLQLATHPRILDIVEALIGPDILIYNVTYIVKEPHSPTHVSWHQDLTYWGFSHDDQVSAWLALSEASAKSGCMRMIPGSHVAGPRYHEINDDKTNVLLQSQTVRDIDELDAELCELKPGEASFHHGWTLHASMPNNSSDRRIGLNVQYLAPHVKQMKHNRDSALLVRGTDRYQHFYNDIPAKAELEPEALRRHAEIEALYLETVGKK